MAKKKNNVNTGAPAGNRPPVTQQNIKPQASRTATAASPKSGFKISQDWIIAGCIAIVTWLFLKICLDNKITNWDDPGYITNNALIKDVSGEGLKQIFSTPIMGNYHPLTILSYAIEYSYVRLEPWLYHLDSLLLHIVVTILVYWFVKVLTKNTVAGGVAALLFGLHPMHVESIAWLAGRKDVLYGTFYMAALLCYVYFVRSQGNTRWKWYGAVTLLYICSLLAKPVAVTLPVTLLLIDYFEQRQWTKAVFIEKLPLFAIAIAFGIKSMMDQKAFGSLATQNVTYSFFERIALGGYAFITYLWKAVLPVGLSCFYPYPVKVDNAIPFQYYLFPVGALVLLGALWLFGRKNRVVMFGSLFFLVNIALLLQFLPVGGAILADRYSYLPYLGLFIMAGYFVSKFYNPQLKTTAGYMALAITGAYALYLGYQSNIRCRAWYDTTSLWRDEIEKQPETPNAYNNLGFNYFNRFNESVNQSERKVFYDSAFYLLHKAIALQPSFANPYISLGELQRAAGNYPDAKKYYYEGIALKDKEGTANAYLGLAITYCITHMFDSALICFRNATVEKGYFPEAHSNFGNYYDMLGMKDSALKEYGIAISQNPDMYAPYINRGRLLYRLSRCDEAMKDFARALEIVPDMGEVYYARSYCYAKNGNKTQALQDVERALSLGYTNIDKNYYQMLKGR